MTHTHTHVHTQSTNHTRAHTYIHKSQAYVSATSFPSHTCLHTPVHTLLIEDDALLAYVCDVFHHHHHHLQTHTDAHTLTRLHKHVGTHRDTKLSPAVSADTYVHVYRHTITHYYTYNTCLLDSLSHLKKLLEFALLRGRWRARSHATPDQLDREIAEASYLCVYRREREMGGGKLVERDCGANSEMK